MGDPQIMLKPFCDNHAAKLCRETKYGPNDTWRALIIASQVAMFQAATVSKSVQKRLEGNIERLQELGCLACRLPQRFAEVIQAGKTHDLGNIKSLGEGWIKEAARKAKLVKLSICPCGHSLLREEIPLGTEYFVQQIEPTHEFKLKCGGCGFTMKGLGSVHANSVFNPDAPPALLPLELFDIAEETKADV